jgi:chromosome segregation ATPase
MSDKKLATFRIDGEVWEQFQELAKADGSNASKLLIDFVNGYIDRRQSRQSVASDIDSLDIGGSNLDTSMDSLDKNQIEQLVVGIVDERTQAIAERMEAIEQRLGEFERLRDSGEDALRQADKNLAKAVAMKCQVDSELQQAREEIKCIRNERDELDRQNDELLKAAANLEDERSKLDERVSDLLLEVENLRDELNECRQQSVAANESVQNRPPLEEMRDRVLRELRLGRQAPGYKSAVKALNLFIDLLG